jgi:hypothetical protein
MPTEKRRAVRRSLTYGAAVVATDGAWRHECKVLDVSESGAQILIDPAVPLPSGFVLSFTKTGSVNRPCNMVWRNKAKVGVRFTTEP